jgi:hypothetical protein
MPAEEGNLVGGPPALIDGDDCKSASSAGFPVHGNVFGVGLGGCERVICEVACAAC